MAQIKSKSHYLQCHAIARIVPITPFHSINHCLRAKSIPTRNLILGFLPDRFHTHIQLDRSPLTLRWSRTPLWYRASPQQRLHKEMHPLLHLNVLAAAANTVSDLLATSFTFHVRTQAILDSCDCEGNFGTAPVSVFRVRTFCFTVLVSILLRRRTTRLRIFIRLPCNHIIGIPFDCCVLI